MLHGMAKAAKRGSNWQRIGDLAARVAARLGTDIQTVIGRETGAVEKPSEEAAPVSPHTVAPVCGHGDKSSSGDDHAAHSLTGECIAISANSGASQ